MLIGDENMLKIVINYDMISRINECNGKYKLIRHYKRNKFLGIVTVISVTKDIVYINCGLGKSVENNLSDILFWLLYYLTLAPLVDVAVEGISPNLGLHTREELAIEDLKDLVKELKNQNINTTYEKILESNVYHRKYKLDMEGAPGIIRERYISVPTYDYNGYENTTSILEEHKLGSRKYVLTLGSPKKKTVLKPAYGV